ncbi:MAG: hypothetical protein MZV70_62780 [Desulfobacterales bacterium]|nr:hypothetical protein [Desulfobacterales bacterium]
MSAGLRISPSSSTRPSPGLLLIGCCNGKHYQGRRCSRSRKAGEKPHGVHQDHDERRHRQLGVRPAAAAARTGPPRTSRLNFAEARDRATSRRSRTAAWGRGEAGTTSGQQEDLAGAAGRGGELRRLPTCSAGCRRVAGEAGDADHKGEIARWPSCESQRGMARSSGCPAIAGQRGAPAASTMSELEVVKQVDQALAALMVGVCQQRQADRTGRS